MNQIFEEFRTILLHQSNCFLLFCQHRVHGINKNEGLLSFANQAQKLRSPFRWGILSLKALPLVVVSTFQQFCSTSCSAKLSTIPVKAAARRRSADQLNEPAKLSLQNPLLGFATQNQLPERSNFRLAKVTGYPLRGLRVRARRGFYPVTFARLNSLSGGSEGSNCRNGATFALRKLPVTRAHFCEAKLPERSSGNPLRGFRPSATRAMLEFEQEGYSESYSAVCSARLAERNSLQSASTTSSASFEPKKIRREPKYSNRVGFTTFLGNTGVKWDAGTEQLSLLNPPSGGSRNRVPVTRAHFCEAKLRERSSGNPLRGFRPSVTRATLKFEQEEGSENARLPCAQPTATRATLEFKQAGAKTCRNGATPAAGCRVATRVELLPNSFGTQHGQAPTEQLKLYSGVTPSLSTTKQNKQQGLTFGKLELLAVPSTARSSSSTFKTNFGVRKTSLNPRATLSLFLWPLVLGPSSPCSCLCSSFLSTNKSYARLEDNLKFTQPFTVWGVVVDTKCCGTKLLECGRSPFSTLLGQSKIRFGVSSPAFCNNTTNTKYKITRPLLNLSRENLTILCKDLHLPVYPDKSNKAVQYSRNRLREQILPAIKLFLNPKIDHALFKLAELLTQDFSLVSNLVNTGRRSSSPLARAHPSGEQGLPGT